MVPVVVPVATMVAPGNGWPLSSTTRPEMTRPLFWAEALMLSAISRHAPK